MNSGRESNELPDLSEKDEIRTVRTESELLTRTIPTSFVTRTAQDRRQALIGRKTRQRYGMED